MSMQDVVFLQFLATGAMAPCQANQCIPISSTSVTTPVK
jgi:hypothetical protein